MCITSRRARSQMRDWRYATMGLLTDRWASKKMKDDSVSPDPFREADIDLCAWWKWNKILRWSAWALTSRSCNFPFRSDGEGLAWQHYSVICELGDTTIFSQYIEIYKRCLSHWPSRNTSQAPIWRMAEGAGGIQFP